MWCCCCRWNYSNNSNARIIMDNFFQNESIATSWFQFIKIYYSDELDPVDQRLWEFCIHLFKKIAKYAKAMAYFTMLLNFLDSLESHQIIYQFWFLLVMLNHIEFPKINIRLFSCTLGAFFYISIHIQYVF